MKIKIILNTGKEIELSKEEFDELKNNFKEMVFQTVPIEKTIPYNPYTPIAPNIPWYGIPEITCEADN